MRKVRAWTARAVAPALSLIPDTTVLRRGAAAAFTLGALGVGGCAQQPHQIAAAHSKEYFPSSVYGNASRRVVESGPIPRGGGQYLVGKPYTVAGQTYYPSERKLVQIGNASWYGDAFHGRLTANGEIYDRDSFSAAHPTMPLPSYARVTNLRNNASMIVRVNDRGPFASNRVMDVSRRVAEALDFKRTGTAKIKVEYVGRASLHGSDDAKLYATLRTNGPAQWHETEPTMVADAAPEPAQVAAVEPVPAPPPAPEREARQAERRLERDLESYPAERPRPVERPAAPRQTAKKAPSAEPLPVERPVHLASRDERQIPHWQRGPEAKAVAWNEPRPVPHGAGQASQVAMAHEPLPPSRPLDLGTIPGAGVPISAGRHAPAGVHVARARDD